MLTLVTSRSFTGTTTTVPEMAQPGDLAILLDAASSLVSGPPDVAPPVGWGLASELSGAFIRSKVFFRVLQPGDAGTEVGPLLDSTFVQEGGVWLLFRPSRGTGYERVLAGAQSTGGNPVAIPMVTTGTASGTVAVVFGLAAITFGNVDLVGTSASMTRSELDLTSMEVAYQVFNAVGAEDLVADMGDLSNDNQLHAVLFVPR